VAGKNGGPQPYNHNEWRVIALGRMEKRNLSSPKETRTFDKEKLELVTVGGVTFGRATFQPAPHLNYHVSGRLHVVMDDGAEDEFGPGDVSQGH
jgi:hypothetical protein